MGLSATATPITLRGKDRRALRQVVRAHTSEQRYVLRARIVLLAGRGKNNCAIADELDCDVRMARRSWNFGERTRPSSHELKFLLIGRGEGRSPSDDA